MNYTTEPPMNYEAVPDVAVHPTCSGLPPLSETMRKTNDVLTECNALVDKLNDIISKQDAEKRPEPPVDCIQRASMANCDLAISLMHKLEMALNALGG